MKSRPPDPYEEEGQRIVSRPHCPKCGGPTTLTDERYGGKHECFKCEMWSWGAGAFRTAKEHVEAKRAKREWRDKYGAYPRRKPAKVMTLDEIGQPDPNAWHVILGVEPTATPDAIKRAYRLKAKQVHPDQGGTSDQMYRLTKARDEGLSR